MGISQRGSPPNTTLFLFLLVFLFHFTSPASVMPAKASGLFDAYRMAEDNDPSFQAIYYQKLATEEGHKQALAELLPRLAGTANYSLTSQDVKRTDNEVYTVGRADYNTTSYGLILTQPIFDYGLYVGLPQSEAESLWAASGFVVAQQQLIIRVTDLYLQALAAKDQLDYAIAEHEAVAKHLELASEQFDLGLAPITDLYDAKARLATNEAIKIEAANLYDDALQALEESTGEPLGELNQLRPEIDLLPPDPVDLDTWIQAALDQNPSIEMRSYAVEVADYEISRQKSGHYPFLSAIGRYNNEDADDSLYGGGSEYDTFDVVLRLTFPFYQGGMISSKVREATYQFSAAKQELVRQERAVRRLVRSAYLGVTTALSQIEALQQSVEANQLAVEAKQEGFLSGLFTSLNVLDAERDLSLVSIDYARARYRYVLNSLRLKAAVGSLSSQDVADLDAWFPEVQKSESQDTSTASIISQKITALAAVDAVNKTAVPAKSHDTGSRVAVEVHAPDAAESTSRQTAVILEDFRPNSLEVSDEVRDDLNNLVDTLTADPQARLVITGYEGAGSGSQADTILPKYRALYIQNILIAKGITGNRIEVTEPGEEPGAPALARDAAGLDRRRVEILVVSNDR